jgi:hypothetical protein
MSDSHSTLDDALLRRVCAEFLEMPGLRLTCKQAQRLWGLEEAACLLLLESLVDAKFLCRPGHGMYTRLTDGSVALNAATSGESPNRRGHPAWEEGGRMSKSGPTESTL